MNPISGSAGGGHRPIVVAVTGGGPVGPIGDGLRHEDETAPEDVFEQLTLSD